MGRHSDVDLLVVKSGEFDQSRLVGDIYVPLPAVHSVNEIVAAVTPEQVGQYRNTHCLIIAPALHEGESTVSERYTPEDPRK